MQGLALRRRMSSFRPASSPSMVLCDRAGTGAMPDGEISGMVVDECGRIVIGNDRKWANTKGTWNAGELTLARLVDTDRNLFEGVRCGVLSHPSRFVGARASGPCTAGSQLGVTVEKMIVSCSNAAARIRCQLFFAATACACACADADAALIWGGGPVVSNAQVVMVNWSSDISPEQAAMPAFYADIVQSDYWSILQQYSTPANQSIGRGAYVQTVTLPLAPCVGQCTLRDIDIIAEIGSRIDADDPLFPTLATDAAGRLNTVFMVHFAANVQILAQGTFNSCYDFLSLYEEFTTDASHGARIVPIAILPDCGSADLETYGASAVLADLVTDPQVFSNPGWYDQQAGSISFICAGEPPATIVANENSYSVTTLWSNGSNACISAERIFSSSFDLP